MTALSINSTGSASPLTAHDTFRVGSSSSTNGSLLSASKVASPSANDTVTLSKNATHDRNVSVSSRGLDPPDFFASYLDALMQQQIGRSMIQKDFAVTDNASTGRTSVLGNYQTLQYQKNIYESVFNLKNNTFQSIFNITA